MRIVACGDALFSGGNLKNRLDPKLLAVLSDADGTFANAEFCCPARETPPAPRRFITAVGAGAIDELTSIGINLLSFANNHTGDFGPQGVVDTIVACEARDVLFSGVGRSLAEARMARFRDTPNGRIGLVSMSTTRAAEFAASAPGTGIAARPGLNPLRWGRAYVLPDKDFRDLQRIEASLGITESRKEVLRVEVVKDPGPDRFGFGSFFEGNLQIERGEKAGVRYFSNEKDRKAILSNVRDAANRAECVLVSVHTHEGTDENWYSERAASFVEEFCRLAVEAGASAVLCHGAHILRGIEFHRGAPIFYSLNSLLMEFEAAETRMTPEMYEAYGFAPEALPSDLHMSRIHDDQGRRQGFYAEPRFSRSVAAICDFVRDTTQVRLVPLDLDLSRPRPTDRGLPAIASAQEGRAIADDLSRLSRFYGTTIRYDDATGMISAQA